MSQKQREHRLTLLGPQLPQPRNPSSSQQAEELNLEANSQSNNANLTAQRSVPEQSTLDIITTTMDLINPKDGETPFVTLMIKRYNTSIPPNFNSAKRLEDYNGFLLNHNQKLRYYCNECQQLFSGQASNMRRHFLSHQAKPVQFGKQNYNALLFLMYKKYFPASLCDDEDFRIATFSQFDGSKTFSTNIDSIITLIKNHIQERIKNKICVFVMDEWKSMEYKFLAILCRTELTTFLLGITSPDELSHTGIVLEERVNAIKEEYLQTDQIIAAITDAGPNMKKCVNLLGFNWFYCNCHLLQNAVKHSIAMMEIFSHFHKRINKIKTAFMNHGKITDYPNGIPHLETYSETRWLSISKSVRSLLHNREFVVNVQQFIDHKNFVPFSEAEFTILDLLSPDLNSIEEINCELEKDDYNAVFCAFQNLMTIAYDVSNSLYSKGFVDESIQLQNEILERLLDNQFTLETLIKSALLNPNINFDDLLPEDENFILLKNLATRLKSEFESIPATIQYDFTTSNISKRGSKRSTEELPEYRKYLIYATAFYGAPLQFWERYQHDLPVLYGHVQALQIISPSSAVVERVFSKCKYAVTSEFGASKIETIEKRIFLMTNIDHFRDALN
jgi:hypothetical protein